VDLAIEAAIMLDQEIDIVGTGSQSKELRRTYKDRANVHFHGHIPDTQVLGFFRESRALLQPQVEDFGITAVEAQSCGLPVVARRAGGALDSIIDTKTGTFFETPDAEELAHAIDRLPDSASTPQNCRINALRFSYDAFTAKLDAVIKATLETT
jgi:glycosyltransferase involved in cell wall biosynthesis